MKGWYGNRQKHSLASKGVSTSFYEGRRRIIEQNQKENIDDEDFMAEGKRRFRKGDFVEVKEDYLFVEPHIGRGSNEPVTVSKGDIGQITHTYKDELEGVHITFKTKDGNVYFDNTDKRFITGVFRKMKRSNPKDKDKINKIFYNEED